MAPSGSSAAARRPAVRPEPKGTPAARRPPLRLFEPAPRRHRSKRRPSVLAATALITASLLSVVVADDLVAQSQVRTAVTQSRLAAAETVQKQLQVTVAEQSAPQIVVTEAQQLGMVAPPQVVDLPYTPLDVALPSPVTTPSAAGTPAK